MKLIAIAGLALLASPAAAQSSRSAMPESISYRAGPCMGGCPIYEVTVRSDGTGTFEGVNFTAVRGQRTFRVTPEQYRAYVRHLAPIRPRRGIVSHTGENCRDFVTDNPSASVTWGDQRGGQGLILNYGCDPQRNRAMARRLATAPGLLPIGDFIGSNR